MGSIANTQQPRSTKAGSAGKQSARHIGLAIRAGLDVGDFDRVETPIHLSPILHFPVPLIARDSISRISESVHSSNAQNHLIAGLISCPVIQDKRPIHSKPPRRVCHEL